MKPENLRKYYIRTYEELYRYVNERMRKASIPPPPRIRTRDRLVELRNALLVKLGVTYNIISGELDKLAEALRVISNMHRFYRELFVARVGRDPGDLSRRFRILRTTATKIYNEYRQEVKTGLTGGEVVRAFKAGIGRLLSIYRRNEQLIRAVKEALIELSRLPDITGDLVVIIAGMPQVGKSTLLRKLTRAKPEISPYPFTTKTIIAGHMIMEPYGRITLIDTPGILDRPLKYRNPIEYKAILAIKYLADITLYLFDANPQSYYSLEQQLRVYRDVQSILEDREIIVIINKIDITPENILGEAVEKIVAETGRKPLLLSAEKGYNLDKLREILIEKLVEKAQRQKP